jgi:hypothetical protein
MNIILKTILLFAFAMIVGLAFGPDLAAQPGLPQPPSQAPIDGGLGLLAAAGGAYAWKKLRKRP